LKAADEFSKRTNGKPRSQCKQCAAAYNKQYRAAHPDEKQAYNKKYRESHRDKKRAYDKKYCESHREELRAKNKEYRETHRDEQRAYSKKYRESHRDEIGSQSKQYRRDNIERCMVISARERAKVKNLQFAITPDDIVVPKFCPLLGIELKRGEGKLHDNSPSLDRIDSTKGYIPKNVWVISHKANTMKRDSTLEEYELVGRNWRAHVDALEFEDE
jgi:hypothetical protein